MSTVYSFFVPKISCGLCVSHIEKKLKDSSFLGVERVASNVSKKQIGIMLRDDLSEDFLQKKIKEALLDTGFTPEFCDDTSVKKQTKMHRFLGILGTVSGLFLLIISMFAGPLPLFIMIPLALTSGILTLVLGAGSYKRAFIEWRSRQLSMDSLFAVSTVVVLITSIASFFVPWLPMMLDTGLLIFGFRHLGLWIEGSLINTLQFGSRFIERLPKQIRVKSSDGRVVFKSIHEVSVGDTIEVLAREYVPFDGECINDKVELYETIITGNPMPREFNKGAQLLSGMEIAEGNSLQLKVTKSFKNSHLYRLDQRMFDADFEEKAGYEIIASRVLSYFVPAVFLFAAVSVVAVGYFFPLAIAIRCGISVLVSACPCTLGLVVPLAVMIGKYKAAKNGIEFCSGEQLQRAGEVDCVVFDFNGTLTMGLPKVVRSSVLNSSLSEAEFFQRVATLEKQSRHPVGSALFDYAKLKGARDEVANVERKYFGVTGQINNKSYLLGSRSMMLNHDVSLCQMNDERVINPGENVVYLACDKLLVGYFVLTTSLRDGAIEAVKLLQKMQIDCYICSGSELETLKQFAEQLSIPLANVKASQRGAIDSELTLNNLDDISAGDANYDDKSRFIKQLQSAGHRVAMVGDAANDAFAISASDFGIAISNAHGEEKITQQKASAVIKGGSLLPVVNAFVIAKQMKTNIKQNLVMSLSYNMLSECLAAGMLASLGVILNPSVGVALMIVQMCLILWNASRFRRQALVHLDTTLKRSDIQEKQCNVQNDLSPRVTSQFNMTPLETPCCSRLFQPLLSERGLPEYTQNSSIIASLSNPI